MLKVVVVLPLGIYVQTLDFTKTSDLFAAGANTNFLDVAWGYEGPLIASFHPVV